MSGSVMLAPVLRAASGAGRVTAAVGRLAGRIAHAAELIASRRDLLQMDERMLQDLGISRAQAEFEASRSPWQAPASDNSLRR